MFFFEFFCLEWMSFTNSNTVTASMLFLQNAQHYSSTPVLLPTMNQVDYRMAPPVKPPRRLDVYDHRSSESSDPSTRLDTDRRGGPSGPGHTTRPSRQPLERSRPETDLHLATHRQPAHYIDPANIPRRAATSVSSGGEDTVPRTNRFQSSIYTDTRPRQIDVVVERPATTNGPPPSQGTTYARTRIAANDYANRRYHSAAADVNRVVPADPPLRRLVTRDPSEERRYKSSYKMLIDNPAQSAARGGGVVQERSRFFNNPPPPRREVAVRRWNRESRPSSYSLWVSRRPMDSFDSS